MARVLFTLALLLVVFTTVRVFGAPTQINEQLESPKLNRQKRTFGFSLLTARDWIELPRPWPFVTVTPLKSMTSTFVEKKEEHTKESLIKRLKDLENGHKRIIEFLKKIQETKSASQCGPSSTERPAEKQPEPVTLSKPESTIAPDIDIRVQTDTPEQPTTQTPTITKITTAEVEEKTIPSTSTKIITTEVEDKVEPSISTKLTTAEVDDKVKPSTSTKITTTEVEDKTVPSTSTKITMAEVEDKTLPSTSTKITMAEVEDKTVPSTSTKITMAEVEDKTVPSTSTKTTMAEVEDKTVPSTPTKITTAEVEVKMESSTPAKITTAEVEHKTEVSNKLQGTSSSEQSTEKVSTEKIETPQVDAEAPAAMTTVETVAETNQETTTQFDEINDINYVLI